MMDRLLALKNSCPEIPILLQKNISAIRLRSRTTEIFVTTQQGKAICYFL